MVGCTAATEKRCLRAESSRAVEREKRQAAQTELRTKTKQLHAEHAKLEKTKARLAAVASGGSRTKRNGGGGGGDAAAAAAAAAAGAPSKRAKTARNDDYTPISQHQGVSWHKASGKWICAIRAAPGEKAQHLGTFVDEEVAAAAFAAASEAIATGQPVALPVHPNRSSKHRGVSWHKGRGEWVAHLSVQGKQQHLGCFAQEADAAAAYTAAKAALAQGQPVAWPEKRRGAAGPAFCLPVPIEIDGGKL